MRKNKRIITESLGNLKRPIRFEENEVQIEVNKDGGKLWVNGPTHCIIRICGIPSNTLIFYNPNTKFLDITITEGKTNDEEE